ncbi:MAG: hypothetical protein GYB66_08675 [Chloroflexi bacterium]|nr:hypothetical protein [Chloroflexota bacterium]
MQPPAHGLLFVFSGPSGAGKNTIMDTVMDSETYLQQLPTATTRAMRDNEAQGREHEFVDEAEFRQLILDKALIEWQIIHDKGVYGVPRRTVQQIIREHQIRVADVDVLGAMALKQEFNGHVVLIFVQPPDKATLEERLRERPDVSSERDLQTRLRRADFEMSFAAEYDHVIVNRDGCLDESVAQAQQIIQHAIQDPPPLYGHPMGWAPEAIHYVVTPVVVQDGQVLQHEDDFPAIDVPPGRLPYEAVRDYLKSGAGIEVEPTRRNADKRVVDIGFEPPQLVHTSSDNGVIDQNMIYILKPVTPVSTLPPSWSLAPIGSVHLDEALEQLLLQTSGDLQLD